MLIVVVVAHNPNVGVKVYVCVPSVVVEITAGDQVPVIPFVEVVGRVPGVAF
jgi:predicted peroxiredoxin